MSLKSNWNGSFGLYYKELKYELLPKFISLTHLLTYLLTHLLTCLLTSSLTYLLIYSLTHSLTQSITHSLNHSLTHSLTHSHTHSLTHSLTYLLTYLLTSWLYGPLTAFVSLITDAPSSLSTAFCRHPLTFNSHTLFSASSSHLNPCLLLLLLTSGNFF